MLTLPAVIYHLELREKLAEILILMQRIGSALFFRDMHVHKAADAGDILHRLVFHEHMIRIGQKADIFHIHIGLKYRALGHGADHIGLLPVQRLDSHRKAVFRGDPADDARHADKLPVCLREADAVRAFARSAAAEYDDPAADALKARAGALKIGLYLRRV
jgi:hypothetical protein